VLGVGVFLLFLLVLAIAVPATVVADFAPSSRAMTARKAAADPDATSGFEGLGSIGADPLVAAVAGWLGLLGPFFALAVLPFGFVYTFGGEPQALVAASFDWSVLALPIGLLVGGLGFFGVVVAQGGEAGLEEGLRMLVQRFASAVVLLLAIAAPCLLYGSLDLRAIVAAKDAVFAPLAAFAGAGGTAGEAGGLAWLVLPAWGVLLDAPALGLFLVAGGIAALRTPIGAADPARGRRERVLDGSRTADRIFFALGGRLEQLVIAGFAVALFLGGGAIPFVSSETLIGETTARLGEAVGNGLALGLHLLVFCGKAVAVIALQRWAVVWWPEDSPRAQVRLMWHVGVPVALLNLGLLGLGLFVSTGGYPWS